MGSSGNRFLRHQDKMRGIIRSAKEVPCKDCGQVFDYYIMEFDHVYGQDFRIGHAGARVGFNRLVEEISKCDVVCSNCHASRTYHRNRT